MARSHSLFALRWWYLTTASLAGLWLLSCSAVAHTAQGRGLGASLRHSMVAPDHGYQTQSPASRADRHARTASGPWQAGRERPHDHHQAAQQDDFTTSIMACCFCASASAGIGSNASRRGAVSRCCRRRYVCSASRGRRPLCRREERCKGALTFDFDACCDRIGTLGAKSPSMISRGEFGPISLRRILDLLDRFGVKSTFFIPGHSAVAFPEPTRMIRAGGPEIGHHGWVHENPAMLTPEQERHVLERGLEALDRIAGAPPVGYRSPETARSRYRCFWNTGLNTRAASWAAITRRIGAVSAMRCFWPAIVTIRFR
jgi:hypothetical protein